MPAAPAQQFPRLSKPVYWLLHLLVFAAFLTEIKLVPSLANNVGLFEIVGGLLILAFLLSRRHGHLELPLAVRIVGLILVLAAVTQIQIPSHNRVFGLVQTAILLFLFLFLVTIHNLGRQHRLNPGYVLKLITYAVLIVGPWILANAFQSADIELVGPFRNRAHMGTYMLTAFWLVLTYSFWPHKPRPRRPVVYAAAAVCLYTVAISGRRSVYIALAVGLAILATAFITAHKGKRLAVMWISVFTIGTLLLLYQYSGALPRVAFFQQRINTIGQRLAMVVDSGREEAPDSFYSLQRQGVRLALSANPVIGIGWGGFPHSQYSLTRHEVHSTPLRFLAETGVLGFLLYAALVACLLFTSLRTFVQMRDTEYGPSFQVLAIGLWSLAVSWTYNRHVTERTFFLLFAVFLLMEGMAREIQSRRLRRPQTVRRPLDRGAGTPLPVPLRQRVGPLVGDRLQGRDPGRGRLLTE